MIFLHERQLKIIEYLGKNKRWVKGSELAKVLKVTDRTIRSDVIAIKEAYGEDIIEAIKAKGYRFNNELYSSEKNLNYDLEMQTPFDRSACILKKLIIEDEPINIYELEEELYVSERSIKENILQLKQFFVSINMDEKEIIKDGEYLSLKTLGYNGCNLLYEFAKSESIDVKCNDLQKYFNDINLDYLNFIIINVLNVSKYKSRYLSVTKLTLDVALMIERIALGSIYYGLKMATELNGIESVEEEYRIIASDLAKEIETRLGVILSIYDIKYISKLLENNQKMDLLEKEMINTINRKDEFYHTCMTIIKRFRDEKCFDFLYNKELIEDLIYHLRIAMKRVELGIKLFNPLSHKLKKEYTYLLDFAVMIADEIGDKYQIKFDFNEISYIGIYLATAVHDIVNKSSEHDKLKVLLHIPEGRGNLKLIKAQIENMISLKRLDLEGITTLSRNQTFHSVTSKYDLIFSTSPMINENFDSKIIVIKKSFDILERTKVKHILDSEIIKLEQRKFFEVFNEYFTKELFITDLDGSTKEDIIEKISKILIEKEYVEYSFIQSVINRENIVTTELDTGIALPHSMKYCAKKNAMAVAILRKPITWNKKKIKIVFLLANGKTNSKNWSIFINSFTDMVLDNSFAESLKKCYSYEDFIELLNKHFDYRRELK